jgi:hypothetical protein
MMDKLFYQTVVMRHHEKLFTKPSMIFDTDIFIWAQRSSDKALALWKIQRNGIFPFKLTWNFSSALLIKVSINTSRIFYNS